MKQGVNMAKSRLENYEDLLATLIDRYLSLDSLAFKCNMDCVNVSERLSFLTKNGLVEQKQCHNKTLYSLTKRGITIQKTLAITKRLDELKTMVKSADEPIVEFAGFSDKRKRPKQNKGNENY